MSSPLSVTVVICTHNRPTLLERCLQALRQVDYPNFVLSIVDNAPDSNEARILAARYGADYLLAPIKGVSRARNIGARAGRGDIIAYIDDDMVPHVDWLKSLINEFSDDRVMSVTGPVLPLAMVDASHAELQLALESNSWGPNRFQLDRRSSRWFERANFGGMGDGNMAFRREAFNRFQGFNEHIGRGATINSGEEHYAYFTLINMGYRVAYAPQAVVFHAPIIQTREYRRNGFSEAIAYAAFLVWRHPRFSSRVASFFAQALVRSRHSAKLVSSGQHDPLSLRELPGPSIRGLLAFWRFLRQSRGDQ